MPSPDALTSGDRHITVASALPPDTLLFRRMSVAESLGRPFVAELDLYSANNSLPLDDLVGETLRVTLQATSTRKRHFHGYVADFSQVDSPTQRYAAYRATLRPWFWLLTRTADCKIYKGTVREIAQKVFETYKFSDFEWRLTGQYKPREYCVQYRETAFNFLSRLFEQEGIYYYHSHTEQKHTLVLCDGYPSHKRMEGSGRVPYYPPDNAQQRDEEYISSWRLRRQVQPGVMVHRDFDFVQPRANMQADAELPREHARSSYEVFDYPGEFPDRGEGSRYAKIRIEELQVEHEQVQGDCDVAMMTTGSLFELTGFPRRDQNREYLVTSTRVFLESNRYESGAGEGGQDVYRCSFAAMDSKETFRPARLTPKPVVQGPQTATVVGKSGEEIWTDEHGRIKVQFHWDRYGKFDENSSCWVRVSQLWAGKEWGTLYLPRIHQEVIVEFLEGDPDSPIVTGRVYNGDHKPPYQLPGKKAVSALKSKSTKGGGELDSNELRMDDTKGAEQLFLQAQKNYDLRVKNDGFRTVEGNLHLQVLKDDHQKVDGDRHLVVKGDHIEEVKGTFSHQAMEQHDKLKTSYALQAGTDIHIKAGTNVVIEAGAMITLKAAGSFITIGGPGVMIKGPMVMINSGGSAGSGAGSSPDKPKEAQPADKGLKSGKEPPRKQPPPKPKKQGPQAKALKARAKSGAPFCEICSGR